MEYAQTIPEAITTVKEKEWTNGMATEAVTVQGEHCFISVMRKCGSPDYPELLRFELKPLHKEGTVPQQAKERNEQFIKESMDLYGDITVSFGKDNIAVIGL